MANNIDWYFIIEQIYQNKCTPIISNQVVNGTLFGSADIVREWAAQVNYPLADSNNLTRVAQYLSVIQHDVARAKSGYLQFLRRGLLELVEKDPRLEPGFLEQLKRERSLTFSQLAIERLAYPNFGQDPDHPFSILAALDISVYLTTSHHHFMEAALRVAGKEPRTEVYAWREGLEDNLPSEYQTNLDFEPGVQQPLVYHLHGIDDYPDSLVLTEDDHLEFLVNVTRDFPRTDVIPSSVRNAISSSLLILLGYDLQAWDLRVLLQGLIKGKPRRPRSFAIQLSTHEKNSVKDQQQFQRYLQEYFDQAQFDVYWGDVRNFMQALWAEWEAG